MSESILERLTYRPRLEMPNNCFDSISLKHHIIESSLWLSICVFFYYYFNLPSLWKQQSLLFTSTAAVAGAPTRRSNESNNNATNDYQNYRWFVRCTEIVVGSGLILIGLCILCCKIISFSGVYAIQPCHLTCFVEGIALLLNPQESSIPTFIAIYLLPSLFGANLALIFPDTVGLELPYELELFWIEHWLIVIVPLYLLLRNNKVALKYVNGFSIAIGLWSLLILHYFIYQVRLLAQVF